jgi:hypothetical protein
MGDSMVDKFRDWIIISLLCVGTLIGIFTRDAMAVSMLLVAACMYYCIGDKHKKEHKGEKK